MSFSVIFPNNELILVNIFMYTECIVAVDYKLLSYLLVADTKYINCQEYHKPPAKVGTYCNILLEI